jgi:AmiR/NasT family two-component response regulator
MTETTDEALALRQKVAQLQTALGARIAIEQAKGILAERHGLSTAEAFELIRYSARSARLTVQGVCSEIVPGAPSPGPILIGLARQQR